MSKTHRPRPVAVEDAAANNNIEESGAPANFAVGPVV
jgi:hypothetical protein